MAVESVGRDGRLVRPLVLIRLDRLRRCFRFGSLFSTVSCFYAFLHTPFPSFCPSFIFATNLFLHIAQTTNVSLIYFMSLFYALLSRAPFLFHPLMFVSWFFLQTLFFFLHLISIFVTIFFVCRSVNLSVSHSQFNRVMDELSSIYISR